MKMLRFMRNSIIQNPCLAGRQAESTRLPSLCSSISGQGITRVGFTLVETLVTLVLIGTIGLIASISLFNLLSGSAKTEIVKEIKQNGDYALSTMEQNIRNATDVYYLVGGVKTCAGTSIDLYIIQPSQPATPIHYSCSSGSLYVDGNSLTSDKVVVNPCTGVFTCNKDVNGLYKNVIINFVLEDAQNSSVSQTYKTEIRLRNK